MTARQLFSLVLLSAIFPLVAKAAERKPDTYLVEYQTFRPNLYFTGNEGPESATFTAVQSQTQWRKLWAELEPRLPRDARQNTSHLLPRIDFTRKTLLVAALGTKPTSGYSIAVECIIENSARINVNLFALNPGKGCDGEIYGITQITTHPIALLLIAKTSKPVQFDTMQVEPACN